MTYNLCDVVVKDGLHVGRVARVDDVETSAIQESL